MRNEKKKKASAEESFYVASQWQLMRGKFKKHKLAIFGGTVLAVFYIMAIFCELFSPYDIHKRYEEYIYCPYQKVHFFDQEGNFHFRPFVYGLQKGFDLATLTRIYTEDKAERYPIYFLVHGDKYKLWNLLPLDIHFFGVKKPGTIFLFGTDELGRDMFSRNVYASRISLSIGLVGVVISFVLGSILGGISGYFGGTADMIIQRVIEFFISIPTIPLWMALAAAVPAGWSVIKTYFAITIILSFLGWCGLGRVVRGKLLELKEEDFIMAAKIAGAIRPPAVSWGALLKGAQNIESVALYPWLLIPGLFVIITVLAFNFLGDGLRDAADPYT